MKQLQLVLGTLVLILTASSAQAERYMLIYKNEQNFSQIHSRWVLSNQLMANRIFSTESSGAKSIQVEESLSHVNSVIVSTTDEMALARLAVRENVQIEKEVFHKAPQPILNYEPTRAWGFDSAYMLGENQILSKRKKTKPVVDDSKEGDSSADFSNFVGPKTPWGILNVKAIEAWPESKQGEGARVLVLDTGIDSLHPALKNQIEEAKDFVGDHQEPNPTADKVGHGSHVAGTIAGEIASNGFSGVAPKAKVLAGRVCSEEGCSSFSVVQGINWGIEKKVDVINLSLGSDFSNNSEKNAIERAEKAGVIIVAASGNDGKASISYPAAYPSVIAVGAIDQKNIKADFSQWGPQLDVVAPGVDVESSVPMGTGCEPKVTVSVPGKPETSANATCFTGSIYLSSVLKKGLVSAGLGKPEDFKGLEMTDKYALIERGDLTFTEKVENAVAANAAGVVLFNNKPGLVSGAVTEDGSTLAIPIIMVEQATGQAIRQSLQAGQNVQVGILTEKSNYSIYSGTSMASPHVAGVVALIRATNKNLTPEQVRTVLKESTTIIHDTAGGPNWYGAGAVNAENAVTKAASLR